MNEPNIVKSRHIVLDMIYVGSSSSPMMATHVGGGTGNDYERMFRLGVCSVNDNARFLLLDLNAAYPIVDQEYAKDYFRGFQKTPDGLNFKYEIEVSNRTFSDHHETGTLKPIFDWIQEQGRGKWSLEHVYAQKYFGNHTFTFHFEDEMTGVWSRMMASDGENRS